MTARLVSDAERRARLVRRHGLDRGFASIGEATEAMVAWHATENATVYLAIAARVPGISPADIDRALYDDRILVKQMAMRRTIFAFSRELLAAAVAGPGERVAGQERRKTVKELGGDAEARALLARLEGAATEALREQPLSTTELRAAHPEIDIRIHIAPGTKWGGEQPIAPRLMTILSAAGLVVRGPNDGHWRRSRPRWVAMDTWLGEQLVLPDPEEAYDDLVAAWLRAYGPGTETDLVWWFGSTKTVIRQALARVGAVEVDLSSGTGWLHPDDLDEVETPAPTAALLPVLDPTTMGWKERDFYLGPHSPHLFDTAGNGGNTAWWDGRVVGGWIQHPDGRIELQLLEDVSAAARAALEARASQLQEWLGETRVFTFFPSPLMGGKRGRTT